MLVRQVCVLDQQIMKVELRFDDAEQPLVRLMHPQPDDATLLAGERANFLDSDFAHTLTISIECAGDAPRRCGRSAASAPTKSSVSVGNPQPVSVHIVSV